MLNKVELRGVVGSVSTSKVSGSTLVRFSVATNCVYKDKDENPIIETTWHSVSAFSEKITNGPDVKRGDKVYVSGRIRIQRYTDSDGIQKSVCEIIANKVEILNADILEYPMQ